MPFNNPVVAGEELIRSAIRSENFTEDSTEVGTGWQIKRDGTATFNNLVTRGDASGPTAAYDDIIANDSFLYLGVELSLLLAPKPNGVLAWGAINPSASYTTSTKVVLMEVQFPVVTGRSYRIYTTSLLVANQTAARSAQMFITMTTDGTEPNENSVKLDTSERFSTNANVFESMRLDGVTFSSVTTTMRACIVLSSVNNNQGVVELNNFGSPLYMFVEDNGLAKNNTAIDRYTPSVPDKQRQSFDILPIDSKSYNESGNLHKSGAELIQGYAQSGSRGNQRGYCWFDYAYLDDLIGVPLADIESLEVFVHMEHWWFSSGGDIVLGRNNNPNITNTEVALGAYDQLRVNYPGRNIGKWIDIKGVADFTNALFTGDMRGFILGPAPSSSAFYYGYTRALFSGFGLRCVYYK